MKKKICVVINNRANYARCKSLLVELKKDKRFELSIIAGASTLLDKYGLAKNVIEKDGFKIKKFIYSIVEGEVPITMAKSTGLGIMELSTAFIEIKPDYVIVIADRFENISVAIAASYMNIKLVHIQGGETTGSIDESVRHAITKFAHIHFPATKNAKKIIEQLGEKKENIHVVGCPSLDLIKKNQLNVNQKFFDIRPSLNGILKFTKGYILVVFHPVTTEFKNIENQIKELIKVIDILIKRNFQIVWLWPNVDAGSDIVSKQIRIYNMKQKKNIFLYKNFTPEDYIKILNNSKIIMGNSSSGIREASYLGVPAINIGSRQNNREKSRNVHDVSCDASKIIKIFNKKIKLKSYPKSKLYGRGNAAKQIIRILLKKKINIKKEFNRI